MKIPENIMFDGRYRIFAGWLKKMQRNRYFGAYFDK